MRRPPGDGGCQDSVFLLSPGFPDQLLSLVLADLERMGASAAITAAHTAMLGARGIPKGAGGFGLLDRLESLTVSRGCSALVGIASCAQVTQLTRDLLERGALLLGRWRCLAGLWHRSSWWEARERFVGGRVASTVAAAAGRWAVADPEADA